ncbi:MAG: hypothetical protein GY827_05510 [Cytophagales bacterium]|nr:hypothetical protein [Cytophagales bacterium]
MDLSNIATVSGKRGLYKVLQPTRSGVILQTLDATGKKMVANANTRVSVLKEISIYTTGAESSVLLEDVFSIINSKYGNNVEIDTKDDQTLFDFLGEIIENYDDERVYASDVKKLVTWYNIIGEFASEIFTEKDESKEEA